MRLHNSDSAAFYWEEYRRREPTQWKVLPDLIQAYQNLNDTVARDQRRATLFQMFESGLDTSLSSQTEYARDYFRVDSTLVEVYEQFKPTGDRQVFIYFYEFDQSGKQIGYFSLGSYEKDNQFARELGQLKPGERIYHLDYYRPKYHATYGMFTQKPTYNYLRSIVNGAIRSTIGPMSNSTFK